MKPTLLQNWWQKDAHDSTLKNENLLVHPWLQIYGNSVNLVPLKRCEKVEQIYKMKKEELEMKNVKNKKMTFYWKAQAFIIFHGRTLNLLQSWMWKQFSKIFFQCKVLGQFSSKKKKQKTAKITFNGELHFTLSCRVRQLAYVRTPTFPPRWNSPCRGEGAYPPRSFNQSASTRRAQLSVAAKAVRSTDLLNHNVKTWVNTD